MDLNWFKKSKAKNNKNTSISHTDDNKNLETHLVDNNVINHSLQPITNYDDHDLEDKVKTVCSDPSSSKDSKGVFNRLKIGLAKTRKVLSYDLNNLFTIKRKIDDELLEELEEILITSDVGIQTSMDLIKKISKQSSKITGVDQLKEILKKEIHLIVDNSKISKPVITHTPHVIMVIGVNGVGKTTTIGKLAVKSTNAGKKVIVAAADTFRAAAVEQLSIWAGRAGADIVKHKEGSDPAAVAFDAVEAAIARNADIVLVDTAGRLHTKVNLMEELKKIKRAICKKIPDAPHEILLVLDATTGQNGLAQAKLFYDEVGITGIVITKLDGTAKGGIIVSICNTMKIPIQYIGIGEQIEDLQQFNSSDFVNALL